MLSIPEEIALDVDVDGGGTYGPRRGNLIIAQMEYREEVWVEVSGRAKRGQNLAHLKNSNITKGRVDNMGQKGDDHKKIIFEHCPLMLSAHYPLQSARPPEEVSSGVLVS